MTSKPLRYIYKIHTSRLKEAKWNLSISPQQARKNKELVSIAESQVIRFIDNFNGRTNIDDKRIDELKRDIKKLKSDKTSKENRNKIKSNYLKLDDLLIVKDYVCLIIDKNKDYDRANKSFFINGVKFSRLLGTTGGIKNSTIVFVSERVKNDLITRIDNGRDKNKEFIPAKLEAYKSLACSASITVSNPKGVLVVNDCKNMIEANVITIDDKDKTKEPVMTPIKNHKIEVNDSDGYGLISPELSKKWADELGLDYIPSGYCVRNSFCKGMLFTVPFHEWAEDKDENTSETNQVIDVWKIEQDITKCQIVLTDSMLKLWDSYKDIQHYLGCCKENGFSFSVTKATPKKLENERHLNYQFLQSLHLSDSNIDKLIEPTVSEIKDVLGGDYRKSLLFLKGIHLSDTSYKKSEYDFAKALMIDKQMIYDPFVKQQIHKMISKRIKESKIGDLRVGGHFSIISGDPISLLQSMFNIKVTGLLGAGEFYSKYWNDNGVDKVACFRAPMTCHNNIRILKLKNTSKMEHWYRYMNTVTIFNSWDTATHALNGADKDSDSVMTTDNEVILQAIKELDAIVCVQKPTKRKLVTEDDFIKANKDSFGDGIGTITNRVTSMIDVQANFKQDSEEYKMLEYRIRCGQNYQQNAIDKAKGIEFNPMPKAWYDYRTNMIDDNDSKIVRKHKEFNLKILADKKPYFMIYRYENTMNEYKRYIRLTEQNCSNRFGCTIEELMSKEDKTAEEIQFVKYYHLKMPVSMGSSVMNKICWQIEKAFDQKRRPKHKESFNYNILSSNSGYSKTRYGQIEELYDEYKTKVQSHMQNKKKQNGDNDDEDKNIRNEFVEDFKRRALEICSDSLELCDIVVQMCYKPNGSKQFAWDVVGDKMIENLLKRNDYIVSYPVLDENGDIEFNGEKFRMVTQKIIESEELCEDYFG